MTTSVWIWFNYRSQVDDIQSTFDRVEKGFSRSLAQNLWEFDEDALAEEVKGISTQPGIVYIKVTTQAGKVITAGSPVERTAISREIPLQISYLNRQVPVGSLVLQSNSRQALNAVLTSIGPIFLFQLFLVCGVALFFFILFNRMITQHLFDISGYLAELGTTMHQSPLVLHRRRREDELDLVADTINRMRDDLLASQQAQAESREMFSRTFYAAPLLMTISRLDDGTYLEVNDTFESISGYSRAEAVGKRSVDLGWISATDRDALKQELLASGRILAKILTLQAKDGSLVTCLFYGEIITFGSNTCLLSIAMDISEQLRTESALRESEERYRSIFEESKAVMLVVDPVDGRIVDANPAASSYYGYPLQVLLSLTMAQINTLSPEEVWAEMQLAVTEERNACHFCHRLASGEEREVVVFSSPVSCQGGEQLFLIVQDVTKRVQAEKQILRLNEELEQRIAERTAELSAANRELESFSYSVSHDLRAPVRHIGAFAQMLAEDHASGLAPDALHCLQRIIRSSTNMAAMIEGLLQLSRFNRAPLQLQALDLGLLAREVVEELIVAAPERRVEWEIAPALHVVGDPVLMRVVLLNLLENAWKYSAQKDVARIEFGSEDQSGEQVYFVRDNGAGFDNTYADKLFTPFQRLHGSDEFAGIGIGLTTVLRIITRHGGRVWGNGAVDAGATFSFTLGAQDAARPA